MQMHMYLVVQVAVMCWRRPGGEGSFTTLLTKAWLGQLILLSTTQSACWWGHDYLVFFSFIFFMILFSSANREVDEKTG